jgi:hypothetical protein
LGGGHVLPFSALLDSENRSPSLPSLSEPLQGKTELDQLEGFGLAEDT